MSGGLKCNPFSVSLVTVGTLLAIICMFAFVLVNVPLDFDTCEDEIQEKEIVYHGIVIQMTEPPIPKPELFSWTYDENRTLSKVERMSYSCRKRGNKLTGQIKKRKMFFRTCLDEIKHIIPKDQHDKSLVYLVTEDRTIADKNMDTLSGIVAMYPFNMSQIDLGRPDVLTAEDIARYRWIAENRNIKTAEPESEVLERTYDSQDVASPTRAVVDVGPCSVRLTFVPTENEGLTMTHLDGGNTTRINMYSSMYTLYSPSYPDYGLSRASRLYKKQLLLQMNHSEDNVISDPCSPSGTYDTLRVPADISADGSPCADDAAPGRNLTTAGDIEAMPTVASTHGDYTLVGTGCTEHCQHRVDTFIQGESISPPTRADFTSMILYLSLPSYLADISSLTNCMKDPDCNATYQQAGKPTNSNSTTMSFGFLKAYVRALVVGGLRIDQDTWERTEIRMANVASHTRWVHGFMINAVSRHPIPPALCTLTHENVRLMERKQRAVSACLILILGGFCIVGLGYAAACKRGDDNWVPSPLSMYQFE